MELPVIVLIDGVRHLQPHKAVSKLRTNELVGLLVRDFVTTRAALVARGYTDLVAMLPDVLCGHRLCAVTHITCRRYGKWVAASLCKPLSKAYPKALAPDSVISVELPTWMNASHHDMLLAMLRLPKETILDYLKHIPSYARPSYNYWSINSCASALLNHIRHQILQLLVMLPFGMFSSLYVHLIVRLKILVPF